ncbi:heterokaryon incompatibility protein-domain-containing protein [Clohesyomyces aquaticus]|uniref:Heterokaryon incompatibility protein-domain-containing protein n=1 Tax=Clohesyomyces aquaticus TaxID=1231657 RepID=A0A1Y1YNJ1_9PLEO|nr:heterokaryon incompatibility protein-domain-containing protein [Clohesyomyces aquaticus]
MVWHTEPQPAHWRVRSQHATRQASRTTRIVYLGIMIPVSMLISLLLLFFFLIIFGILLLLLIFFYVLLLTFFPVYAIAGFFAIWSLYLLKKLTGAGPEWLRENPSGLIKEKAKGFKEIFIFACTWRWTAADESDESDKFFWDPKGPYQPYTYEALSTNIDDHEIRVLDLLPGPVDSPIRCRIRHISLRQGEPVYEAISYCWGGEVPSIPVYVHEETEGEPRQILATRNLVQAFQRFRQSDQQRTIWADGICINQGRDPQATEERNRQVKLMGLIYQKAKQCLIWLGRGAEDAKENLDAIKELVRLQTELTSAGFDKDPIFLSPEEKAQHKIPHGQTPHLKGLQLILSNIWLTRTWIVQEASLAQQATIYMGNGSVSWDDLVAAQSFAKNIGLLTAESEAPMNGMTAIFCNRIFQDSRLPVKGEGNILALLARRRNFDATNASDKVYGLISLLSERHHAQWPVGLGAEQAYLDAANRILHNGKTLDLLGIPRILDPSIHLEREKQERINIPTWVPDWRSNQVPISLRMLEFSPHGDRKFTATMDSMYEVNLSQGGRLLGVDGYGISIIQNLGALFSSRPVPMAISPTEFMCRRVNEIIAHGETYNKWKQTLEIFSHQGRNYPHSAMTMSTQEAFWRTISAYEPTSHDVGLTRLAESFEAYDIMMTLMRKRSLFIKAIPLIFAVHNHWLGHILLSPCTPMLYAFYGIMAQDPEAQDFCNSMVFAIGRRMARTADGHFALVPGNAVAGDEITLLKGARAPIVLRKHLETDHWEHVGEAYVEGLMNGEQWDENRCERRWLA